MQIHLTYLARFRRMHAVFGRLAPQFIRGKQALLFGGYNADTSVKLLNSDTQAVVHSAVGKDTLAPDENIYILNGRRRITINGTEIERPIIYDYT